MRRLPSTQGVGVESLVVSFKGGRSRVLRHDDHLKEACGTAISAHLQRGIQQSCRTRLRGFFCLCVNVCPNTTRRNRHSASWCEFVRRSRRPSLSRSIQNRVFTVLELTEVTVMMDMRPCTTS